MKKRDILTLVDEKLKLLRTEAGYTQHEMAEILGLSKKTLVNIEKKRSGASWTVAVAVCSLFRRSDILQSSLGGDPLDVIELLAHEKMDTPKSKTLGGKIWWKEVEQKGRFTLQQNHISTHFRILDEKQNRWFSTFDENEALIFLKKLVGEENNEN